MAQTEYFATKGSSANDLNGGGPRLGTNDGPVDSSDDCTSVELDQTITNNEGDWTDVQADDWLVWNYDDTPFWRRVVSVDGAVIHIAGALADGANKKVRVGGAFATIDHAASLLEYGYMNADDDPVRVNIEEGIWTEAVGTDHAGSVDKNITYEGFTTTPGDGGIVTIDGQDSHSCITTNVVATPQYLRFKNIRCINSNARGFNFYQKSDVQFIGCDAYDNATGGIYGGDRCTAVDCDSYSNGNSGIYFYYLGTVIGCRAWANASNQTYLYSGAALHNWMQSGEASTAACLRIGYVDVYPVRIFNNTFDGYAGQAVGLDLDQYTTSRIVLLGNNIFYNCKVGVEATSGLQGGLIYNDYNLYYGNTAPRTSWPVGEHDIDDEDPLFVDAASRDYRLLPSSPARRSGFLSFNIGALDVIFDEAEEVHLLKALSYNKRTKDVATGVLTIYDDDDTTPIAVITPTLSGGVLTLTPTWPNAGTPGTYADEVHKAKAFLMNKREVDIVTQAITVYDDDDTTELFTATPTTADGATTVESA